MDLRYIYCRRKYSVISKDNKMCISFNNLTTLWSELDMLLPSQNCICDAERVYYERE